MKILSLAASAALAVCCASALASCSDDARFEGIWKSIAPITITDQADGSESILADITMNFGENQNNDGGDLGITYGFTAVKPLGDGKAAPGEITVKGTAEVPGHWTYDIDDDDNLLIEINSSAIKVNIDKENITFAGAGAAALTDAQRESMAEDLAKRCAAGMKAAIEADARRFTVIEDVEVSKDRKTLGFETKSPKTDYRFRRVGI